MCKNEGCVLIMQIQAINNQSFGQGAQGSKESGAKRRANIDAAISIPDSDLKAFAYYQACVQTDDDKHRKINNAAIMSLPVVAAVRDTVLTRGEPVKLLGSKIMPGAAARVITGAKTLGRWGGALAAAIAVGTAAGKLEEKSEKFRKFTNNQPYTAMAAAFGAAAATYYAAGSGISKAAKALISKNPMPFWKNVARKVVAFDNNKVVKNVANAYIKMSDKIHPAIKGMGKLGLAFAPLAIGVSAVVHSLNHSAVRNRQAAQNYTNLKTAQAVLANARARELGELN